MPTTVTASNSVVYHLWQLPAESLPEPEDQVHYNTLDVPLPDGFRSGFGTGFAAGTKSWKLTLPTLAGTDVLPLSTTRLKDAPASREQYIRQLYADNKITGTPFVFLDTNSNTYHFVDFADEQLTLTRMRVKIFVTGFTLKERRIAGVTLPSP